MMDDPKGQLMNYWLHDLKGQAVDELLVPLFKGSFD
jgi:hypothetical protein